MFATRIIPALLVHQGGLVKTVKFSAPRYLGDPLNAVRIFNEKHVDELCMFDIDATLERRSPNLQLIERLAAECRMPLCYGGGVRSVSDVEGLVGLGVEKVAIGGALVAKPELLEQAAARVGRQSLVAVLDVRHSGVSHEVFLRNGTVNTGIEAVAFAAECARRGAGEILVNSIDRDGTLEGYDIDLARRIKEAIDVPLTMLGGAGSVEHIAQLIRSVGIVGAAAGSLFVFKGPRQAVLLNYLRAEQRASLPVVPVSGPSARFPA